MTQKDIFLIIITARALLHLCSEFIPRAAGLNIQYVNDLCFISKCLSVFTFRKYWQLRYSPSLRGVFAAAISLAKLHLIFPGIAALRSQ